MGQLPNNAFLVTLDVSSLYAISPTTKASMPVDTSSTHVTTTLRLSKLKVFDLIRMILTMNNFSFNDKRHLQVYVTAMGIRTAYSYANLFLAKFEINALSRAPYQPHAWWRYIGVSTKRRPKT